uniref:Uncharacterized protein n=1 Tax=Rhizophora mucronata TaxID=61149 RepID=A0A2P2Q743_RHIMU
MQTRLMHPSL